MKQLDIIYEDNDIILVHKSAGVATQTKRLGQQDMESLLKNYRAKKNEAPYIGVVHRLDQPVEGIMVFAKNQKAAAHLSKQVQQHLIGKYYYALTEKEPIKRAGVLEDYLLTDKKTNVTQVIEEEALNQVENSKEIKKAKLEYEVVDTKEDKTLLRIKLHTGRQHQIRVQMSHMGAPLVGDSKYGLTDGRDKSELALCSYRLEFQHPVTNKKMEYEVKPKGNVFQSFFA